MLETTFHSLTAVLIVMFMVAVGWLFGKLGYLRREHKKLMTKLIISAGMPSLVVNTVFGKIDLDALQNPALHDYNSSARLYFCKAAETRGKTARRVYCDVCFFKFSFCRTADEHRAFRR